MKPFIVLVRQLRPIEDGDFVVLYGRCADRFNNVPNNIRDAIKRAVSHWIVYDQEGIDYLAQYPDKIFTLRDLAANYQSLSLRERLASYGIENLRVEAASCMDYDESWEMGDNLVDRRMCNPNAGRKKQAPKEKPNDDRDRQPGSEHDPGSPAILSTPGDGRAEQPS